MCTTRTGILLSFVRSFSTGCKKKMICAKFGPSRRSWEGRGLKCYMLRRTSRAIVDGRDQSDETRQRPIKSRLIYCDDNHSDTIRGRYCGTCVWSMQVVRRVCLCVLVRAATLCWCSLEERATRHWQPYGQGVGGQSRGCPVYQEGESPWPVHLYVRVEGGWYPYNRFKYSVVKLRPRW